MRVVRVDHEEKIFDSTSFDFNQESNERSFSRDSSLSEVDQKLVSLNKHIFLNNKKIFKNKRRFKKTFHLPYQEEDILEVEHFFKELVSLEHQIAQLFFFVPTNDYCNIDSFFENISLRLSGNIGGVLLNNGYFENIYEKIEKRNKSMRIPLIIGCDTIYALNTYLNRKNRRLFDCEDLFYIGKDMRHMFSDLGVSLFFLMRDNLMLDKESYSKLIKGLKQNNSVFGSLVDIGDKDRRTTCNPGFLRYSLMKTIKTLASKVDFSVLKFSQISLIKNKDLIIDFINDEGDGFIVSSYDELQLGIQTIKRCINEGHISPNILNKKLFKMLLLKKLS